MKKTITALGICAFLLGACDPAENTETTAELSPYATASGIDKTGFDENVSPREDFFRYVNGTWIANAEIPGDRGTYGAFAMLRDESEINQRKIIEDLSTSDDLVAGSEEQKIGLFFASILDQSLVEGKGAEPIQSYLDMIDALDSKSAVVGFFGEANYFGVAAPMGTAIFPDLGDSSRYMNYIFQGGLALPGRDYYLDEGEKFVEIRSAYPPYIASLLEMAGFDNAAERADKIFAIEMALAEKHWSPEQNRNIPALYNLMGTEDLGNVSTSIDWQAYMDGAGLAGRTELVVAQLSYFEALGGIIENTSLEDWQDYLRFQILDGAAQFLSSEFADARFDFMGALVGGLEEQTPRWKTGVRVINATLGEAVGKVYVERHFPPAAKEQMQDLVANLMEAFRTGIVELDWMSDETKAMAEDKRSKMMTKIGYPDEWEDYSTLEIIADDPIANLAAATRWGYQDNIDKLDQEIDRNEWGMTPQTVNAYHNPTMNEIVFPAAILQPPFFNLSADPAVNYGSIGAVIGHEIGHAFDDQGRRFDGAGNMRDWWTEEDSGAFEARAATLVSQYDQFSPLEGLNVNGQLTLGENIGDLTGVTLAYRAYKNSLGGEEAPVIDGMTGDQRFFIGFAQVWRSIAREEATRQRVLTDPHSPPEFRTNGTLRNIPEFYEAFGIVEGDAMYLPPEERVKIW